MRSLFLYTTLIFLWPFCCLAITIDESISLALQNNTKVAIESKKSELVGLSRYEAATGFLPSVSLDYQNGTRRTKIGDISEKQNNDRRVFSVNQPLFDGFSSVSKFRESLYKTKSAREELALQKNNIAYQVAYEFLNIIKFQKLVAIEREFDEFYDKIVSIAQKKLKLKFISHQEFSDYLFKAQKNKIQLGQDIMAFDNAKLSLQNYTHNEAVKFEDFKIKESFKNFDDFLTQVLSKNPQIRSTKFSHQAKKAATYSESGKILPKISLNFQEEKQESSYYLNGQDVRNRSVYVNFSIPIFQSGVEYYSISSARKEQQIAHLEARSAIEEVEKEARMQFQNFSALTNYIEILENSAKNLEKTLKIEEKRLLKRDIDKIEFLMRKIELAEVKKALIEKEYERALSYYKMKFLINEITTIN